MKLSLRNRTVVGASNTSEEAANGDPKETGVSRQDYFPSRMLGEKVRRKNNFGTVVGQLFLILLLILIPLGVFCYFDLSEYRQWVTATELLPDLRKAAGDDVRAAALAQLAITVDPGNVSLKSGLLGVLAIRKVGLGQREVGLRNCKQVCQQFPTSWFASQFSEASFYGSCPACAAKGSVPVACYHCRGTGGCSRCGGSGECSTFMGNSRPSGSGGDIRNTGKFQGMGEKCLDCKGTMRCRYCGGKKTLSGTCAKCEGEGCQFSKQKVIEQYRAVIDYVLGLHPSWVATVVRLQATVKSWIPFF